MSKISINFISGMLDDSDRPELKVFPVRVCFVSFGGSAIYQPDLDSFCETKKGREMTYKNNIDPTWYLKIKYNKDGSYMGEKYHNKKCMGGAFGKNWKGFSFFLTSAGVAKGEPCK